MQVFVAVISFLFVAAVQAKDEEYDYIIVGASAAGCVLANRLSADENTTVLLLDEGWGPNILSGIPALVPAMYYMPQNSKYYLMEEENNVGLGLKDKRQSALKGKGLGGTTIMEHMMHTRGHKNDYEKWAEMGNPDWSYEKVLPHFKRSESAFIKNFNAKSRSSGGEYPVSETVYRTNAVYSFMDAATKSGLKFNEDYNAGDSLGVGFIQSCQKDGWKYNAERAFLKPIRGRKNLKIKKRTKVMRILINPETKTAEGVIYESWFSTSKVMARKEVILSAGVFGSPQLLMLSGVGSKEHLKDLDIPVIKDLPVGNSMDDHFMYPYMTYKVNDSSTMMFGQLLNPINLGKFFLKSKGPYTVPTFVIEAIAFAQSQFANKTFGVPDIELIYISGSFNTDYGIFFKNQFRLDRPAFNAIYRPLFGQHVINFLVVNLHPISKGLFRLKSKDPNEFPIIRGNYLNDPDNQDLKILIEGIRLVQKIASSPEMKKIGAEPVLTPTPGCEDKKVDSDEFWECQIRHIGANIWHQVGTCKMGPEDDPSAVVDSKLRVHGIKKLRVVDTSVIPLSLSAHTTGPALMIGEKAADFILSQNS